MGEHSGWLTKLRPGREEGLGESGRCLEVKGTCIVVQQSVQSNMTILPEGSLLWASFFSTGASPHGVRSSRPERMCLPQAHIHTPSARPQIPCPSDSESTFGDSATPPWVFYPRIVSWPVKGWLQVAVWEGDGVYTCKLGHPPCICQDCCGVGRG